jgi:homoserine dehydrogenase
VFPILACKRQQGKKTENKQTKLTLPSISSDPHLSCYTKVSENKSSHETRQESGFLRHSFKKQIHNLSRNANSQKQSDFYSSTAAAGAPSLPLFPRSRSSAIRSLSTQQQENTQNAGEGGKKLKKTITNANAKTTNQKITKIKIKTVKNRSQKKRNCKNNKTKLLSQQTTQTKQSEAREKIETKEIVKNSVPPDATPSPPPPPSSHSKQNQTRLL